jgi:hypothetical protein
MSTSHMEKNFSVKELGKDKWAFRNKLYKFLDDLIQVPELKRETT